jgi:hypothetical protein
MPTYKQDLKATTGNAPTMYIDPVTGQEIPNQQLTYTTPVPGNQMGVAKPLFNDSVTAASNKIFGNVDQRQRSLQNQAGVIQSPMYFKDQTGDGKITKADVIKARIEGYKK